MNMMQVPALLCPGYPRGDLISAAYYLIKKISVNLPEGVQVMNHFRHGICLRGFPGQEVTPYSSLV